MHKNAQCSIICKHWNARNTVEPTAGRRLAKWLPACVSASAAMETLSQYSNLKIKICSQNLGDFTYMSIFKILCLHSVKPYTCVYVYICTHGKIFAGVQNIMLGISRWWNYKAVFMHYKKISAVVLKFCKKSLKIRGRSVWSVCDKERKSTLQRCPQPISMKTNWKHIISS